jgi:uncharacterized membrane protein YhaH (DUF805 family)
MLQAVFSFRGRLGRVAFLGWMAAATALVFVIAFLFLALGGVLAGTFSADGAGPHMLGMVMGVTAAAVGIWTTLALQTKRISDMGFRPLTWMLGVTVVMMADQWLLTQFTDLRFFPPFHQYTPLGGFAAATYMVVLLLWPSAEEPQATPSSAPRPTRTAPSPASATLLATRRGRKAAPNSDCVPGPDACASSPSPPSLS